MSKSAAYIRVFRAVAGTLACCVCVTGSFAAEPAGPSWKMQYFYDKAQQTFVFADLSCPDNQHCYAIGVINDKGGKSQPEFLRTSDGGANWAYSELKEVPDSLYFLDAMHGWFTSDKGIWRTVDGGGKWDKISKEVGIEDLYFADASHGYAAGVGGRLLETTNGGQDWHELAIGSLPYPKDQISFEWVTFLGPDHGILAGSAFPYGQRISMRPDWMDPERARRMHAPPTVSFVAETKDSGKTWQAGKPFSNYGNLLRSRCLADGRALVTLQFDDGSPWPSHLEQVDPETGKTILIFRRKDRVIKDALQLKSNDYVIATIEPPGTSTALPIPGKIKMVRGHGGDSWVEDPVDYRAVARNLILAASPDEHLWVATDTGMILAFMPGAQGDGGPRPGGR